MARRLVLKVHFHGDAQGTARYHGTSQGASEWPPSPARVFQALVAAAARGNYVTDEVGAALRWLERLPPPIIAAPHAQLSQRVTHFVPNNDGDTLADPRDVSTIRTGKKVQARMFPADRPLIYAWAIDAHDTRVEALLAAATQLYQLGRGVDMAWAGGEVMDDEALDSLLHAYLGHVHRPGHGPGARVLLCPTHGTFDSLEARHRAPKVVIQSGGRNARILFSNPPKPRLTAVTYDAARHRAVFNLTRVGSTTAFPWALTRVVQLVEIVRDAAAHRLRTALVDQEHLVDRLLVGRHAEGARAPSVEARVRIIPLPSIGHRHADRAVRRILLDVATGTGLSEHDVEWALSGLPCQTPGAKAGFVVTPTDDEQMLRHYTGSSRRWRSVTPVVLPESAARRRIEPSRMREESKGALERVAEEGRAAAAVIAALRHAGVRAAPSFVRVQREPFEARGSRAESFAAGTRFGKERLWHVEFELERQAEGPLVIGDGRFLGLGVMAHVE